MIQFAHRLKRMRPLVYAGLLLAGCVAGPTYRVPESPLTSAMPSSAALEHRAGEGPAPTLDVWWSGFQDAALTNIIECALHENLDLAVSMARVEQARATAQGAGAVRLPQASINGQSLLQHQSLSSPQGQIASAFPGYDRRQNWNLLGVGASWELDLAGGLKREQQAATGEWQAAVAGQTGVKISIAAEAADAYFRIRGAQRRIVVVGEQIRTEENLVTLVRDRFSGGLSNNRELAQAQALLLEARATVPPLRTELSQQTNRLDVLMGAQPGSYAKALVDQESAFRVPAIAADLNASELLRRRPDVIAAERRLQASSARIGVAIADYYPKVSIGGLLGFDSLNAALFTTAAFEPQALLGLHWRLFDFGRVDAEVARARGVHAQALAEYRQSLLRASEEVENAIVSLTELELQRLELEQEVDAQHVARNAAQDAYEGGAVSLIEVLDEDRQLLHARDLLAQVDANDARAAVATFRALGGGWAPPRVP